MKDRYRIYYPGSSRSRQEMVQGLNGQITARHLRNGTTVHDRVFTTWQDDLNAQGVEFETTDDFNAAHKLIRDGVGRFNPAPGVHLDRDPLSDLPSIWEKVKGFLANARALKRDTEAAGALKLPVSVIAAALNADGSPFEIKEGYILPRQPTV